jgi:recA bacterial DNA recombination protein
MRPLDLTKFKKDISKSLDNVSIGFHDPETWISTGNYALNKAISGSFYRGIPLGKVVVLAGESGSGKSLLASGTIVKNAQDQGIFVVLIDSENALDTDWLQAFGVDTSDDKLLKLNSAMVDDVAKIISTFMKDYKTSYKDTAKNERPKVLFVIDSLGMLLTPTDVNQFEAGEMKGDMGRKAKALKALVTNCVNMFGEWDIGLLATNHIYASQNQFSPDDVISGGCIVAGTKIKLENNSLVNIEDVKLGDMIQTMNGPQSVVSLWNYEKPTYTFELEDGYIFECSPEHKFLINVNGTQRWLSAEELSEGDSILSIS